jgi:hypothetical protein
MLSLVQERIVGGAPSSLAELRFAKKMAASLLETAISLSNFEAWGGVGKQPDTLFLNRIGGEDLVNLPEGALVIVPSRQALNPTVAGAVELLPDPASHETIMHCGGYVFERSFADRVGRTIFFKLTATFSAADPVHLSYDPEPEALARGLTWRLEVPVGFVGKVFSGGEDFLDWLAQMGHLPKIPQVVPGPLPPLPAARGSVGLPTSSVATTGGKLGYINFTDTDGRIWRASAWKDFQADYKSSLNWVRSSDWERYKFIAGEFVVKTDVEGWTKKLLSYEHVSPCPAWADTICHLSIVKKLNIFGKEQLFFSGDISRNDYSQLSWEQFVPKGHVYDRENSFNSLMLACDGFRIASLFYYGKAWDLVAMGFKRRLESGNLREFLPEYVNYLAHQGLVLFYSVMQTLEVQADYLFASELDPPLIFDRCMESMVNLARFSDITFWKRYEEHWKKDISFSITSSKRKTGEPEVRAAKKVTTVATKTYVKLGVKEFVCWRTVEALLNLPPLNMTKVALKASCPGKPACRGFHADIQGIPNRADFLANVKASKALEPADKIVVEKAMSVWY